MSNCIARARRAVYVVLACVLVALSVAIQAHGAFDHDTATWNWSPRFLDPARVWSWGDPQFLA